jgi:hypothetical protein
MSIRGVDTTHPVTPLLPTVLIGPAGKGRPPREGRPMKATP